MAVLSYDSVMSSAENDQTTDSSHENNLYADRQLQNKLLQLEEDSDNEAYDQRLSRSWSNLKGTTKSHKTVDSITGWFPNSKFVGRKNELQRPETKPAFIHPWKDYRSRGKEDSFVFKHYTECRKYIEQYRIEHGCHVNRFPSGNQIGDMRRIAFQGSAPPQHSPISVQQMQQSGYSSITPQPPSSNQHSSLHYANRKEQLGTLITGTNGSVSNKTNYIEPSSHAQKYRVNNSKLPRNNTVYDMRNQDSDNSSDCGDIRLRSPSRRSNSASSQRAKSRNITKSPTKITVPASPSTRSYPLQALTIQQNCKPDVCPSPKPLDNLNCVAPEKQKSLKRDQELANLTWSEKLEALRSVNKPSEKPKPKQPKLKFVKAEPTEAMIVWSLDHDPLHEQQRIQSLVEHARLKGGKQYDWVYEAHVRHRNIDWNAVGNEEKKSHETGEVKTADNQSVVKYGIYSSTSEPIKQTLFSSRSSDKSSTSQT